jgi:hypothetical protein
MEEKELTPNETRGVDLIVKSLMKKYNFIQGWSPVDDYTKYYNTLFIHLLVDYDMVSDYFGMRIRPSIKLHLNNKDPEWWGREIYSLTAFLDEPEGYTGGYDTKTNMRNLTETLYKQLPPQLQRTYPYDYLNKTEQIPVVLMIHGFVVY